VLLLGPPGCGKGTQAEALALRFSVPAISTGEILRAECDAGTALGRKAKAILEQGKLLDDVLVNAIVAGRISQNDCRNGFILDGYPRTVAQAMALTKLLRQRNLPSPLLIHIDVAEELLVGRLTARRQCPTCHHIYNLLSQPPRVPDVCDADQTPLVTRSDDTAAVARRRLEEYRAATGPILAWYPHDTIIDVDGGQAPSAVTDAIEHALAHAGVMVA
jgi:adenylate kinase